MATRLESSLKEQSNRLVNTHYIFDTTTTISPFNKERHETKLQFCCLPFCILMEHHFEAFLYTYICILYV